MNPDHNACTECLKETDTLEGLQGTLPHYHRNSQGKLVACYHACKSVILSPGFWIGTSISFPIEHYLWEKVWPFTLLTAWLGLD